MPRFQTKLFSYSSLPCAEQGPRPRFVSTASQSPKLGAVAKPTQCSHKKLEDVLVHNTLARESVRRPPPPATKSLFPRIPCRIESVPAAMHGTKKFSMSCVTPETLVIGHPHVDVSSSWSAATVLRAREHVSVISFIQSQCVQWMTHMDHCGEIMNDVFPVMRDDVLTQRCSKEARRHVGLLRPRPFVQPLMCSNPCALSVLVCFQTNPSRESPQA